ncbi:hypothetical protein [Dactylosporangium sp. CA-139066]|uniref:hypothetical protein n=1 Tax=Dactylosporangium sp. CA-139066 TaxID=3239930 RepID=UPI003D8D1F10
MTTSNGLAHQAPLYVRALRLRHLHVGGFVSFLLFECMIAVGVLLALAELVSWWAVPVLPAVVAIMVKVNDMVIGGSRRVRAQARSAGRGSSDRASSIRVDPDARTDERASVARRTATALDRADLARPPAGGTPTADAAPADSGPPAAVRTRVVEPPAQRKKVGVIKISVPPRDAAPRRGAVDAGHGISPASDEAVAAAAAARAEPVAPEPTTDGGAHRSAADAAAHESVSGPALSAAAEEWTDTDSHGFQRSKPLHPSGWSDRPAQDPWAEHAAEPVRATAPEVSADWATETAAGWGDREAWTAPVGGTARGNWGDETAWGDREQWAAQSAAAAHRAGAHHQDGVYQGVSQRQAPYEREAAYQGVYEGGRSSGGYQAPAQPAADWDDETGWADQAAWRSSRSSYGSRSSWDPYAGWESGAPDYVSDYTGEETDPRSAFGSATREQAARDLAARGEAYRSGESHGSTYGHAHYDDAAAPAADGYGYGDAAQSADAPGASTGERARSGYGYGDSTGDGYGGSAGGGYGGSGGDGYGGSGGDGYGGSTGDIARSGHVYGGATDGGYGPSGDAYGRSGEAPHEQVNGGRDREPDGRPQNRDSAGGRHARHQPPGRRRSEDGEGTTSGHFTTGRHAERPWRSEEDLARQRAGGGINQGRFA